MVVAKTGFKNISWHVALLNFTAYDKKNMLTQKASKYSSYEEAK